jgi:CheY-like chemotaxis protein
VAKQLRADFGGAIRIIAITAYGTEAERQRGIEAGIDLHLLKPARTELLESLLG